MNHRTIRLSLTCVIAAVFLLFFNPWLAAWESKQATDTDGFPYEYIPDDPFEARIYTLENGLKIYLSQNREQPRILSLIAVRAGSADDPTASTGLAHYFEHMMFKGNSHIATLDWEKEEKLLDGIEELFNQYRAEKDTEKRAEIYKQIDKLSLDAAQYSNDEYWEVLRSIGATEINAWTSYDETVYISEIPAIMLDKFMYLEYVRFSGIALRRFHTELETVYEEFNRSQDNGRRIAWEALSGKLFAKHPYKRSVIGLPEHLKSPSMTDIKKFFTSHYIPRNMAVVLAGDLEYEQTMRTVRKYFSLLKNPDPPQQIEQTRIMEDAPLNGIQTAEVSHPDSEFVEIAYRFDVTEENIMMLDMIDMLMNNGLCGIMELDLELPRKVLSESSGTNRLRDYLIHIYTATPTEGKTLEETRDMILAEIEKLKRGEFPDWMLKAIVNNSRLGLLTVAENPRNAAEVLKDCFIQGSSFADELNRIDRMEKVTKEQIMAFAQANLKDNYVVLIKRSAPNPNQVSAVKPPISTLPVNGELSTFAKNFIKLPSEPEPEPEFPDFKKDLKLYEIPNMKTLSVSAIPPEDLRLKTIQSEIKLWASKNDVNERFSLTFTFPVGTRADKEFTIALGILDSLGTSKYSAQELKQEWFKLASSMSTFSGIDTCGFTLSGLQRNFDETLKLFWHIIQNVQPDDEALGVYVAAVEKSRKNRKTSASSRNSAAAAFALYNGPDNYQADIMPIADMKKITCEQLTKRIAKAFDYEYDISYYGPEDIGKISDSLSSMNLQMGWTKKWPETKYFNIPDHKENEVFVINMPDAAQSYITVYRIDEPFNTTQYPFEAVYTDCAARLFMTELREKKALAYSVYGCYQTPGISPNAKSFAAGVIQSQHDKLLTSLDGVIDLFNNDPTTEQQFKTARESVLSQIRNSRVHKDAYRATLRQMEKFKLHETMDETVYKGLQSMDFTGYRDIVKSHISVHPNLVVILTDTSKFDVKQLDAYGKVRILTMDEIFPND